jgi:hypothetical protein
MIRINLKDLVHIKRDKDILMKPSMKYVKETQYNHLPIFTCAST